MLRPLPREPVTQKLLILYTNIQRRKHASKGLTTQPYEAPFAMQLVHYTFLGQASYILAIYLD